MTRISQCNAYAGVPIKRIEAYKKEIDESIDHNWAGGGGDRDFALMPAFIARANEKDKNLHAFFLPNGIKELTEKIDALTRDGVTSARFLVNVGERDGRMRYHFAAFDYKATPGKKASLIGIDPAVGADPGLVPQLRARFGPPSCWMISKQRSEQSFPARRLSSWKPIYKRVRQVAACLAWHS